MTDYLKKISEIRNGDLKDFIEVRDPEGIQWLEDQVTAGVLKEFLCYCAIPHGTYEEKNIVDWFVGRFEEKGWKSYVDQGLNLVCDIPATPGYENVPMMAIQGHTDMVCAYLEGGSYNPLTDSVNVVIRRDEKSGRLVMSSDGVSSLGADCGLGNAAALYLLEDETLAHGPVRLILTAKEEIGLVGVKELNPHVLDGVAVMANVDGFDCCKIVAGSASGRRVTYGRKIESEEVNQDAGLATVEISVGGLKGGHSGFDIHFGRGNAIKILLRVLSEIKKQGGDFRISAINGGIRHNVIPVNASAVIVADDKTVALATKVTAEVTGDLTAELAGIDEDVFVIAKGADPVTEILTADCQDRMLTLAEGIFSGVYRHMEDMPAVPHTSANLGGIQCNAAEGGQYEISLFERSMGGKLRAEIAELHDKVAAETGFEAILMDGYEPWVFNPENRFLALASEEYTKASGVETEIKVSHVGLEPSVLGEFNGGVEMVCIGTDIIDAHSVSERVNLDTVKTFTQALRNIIQRYSEENK